MASGFGSPEGVQLEMEAVLQEAIQHARKQINLGAESEEYCLECDKQIPEKRRIALLGVRYCVECQSSKDEIFKRQPRNCWHRSMR